MCLKVFLTRHWRNTDFIKGFVTLTTIAFLISGIVVISSIPIGAQAATGGASVSQKGSNTATGLSSLSATISFAKNPIKPGQVQTIKALVVSSISQKKISGANIHATVIYAGGSTTKQLTNTTNASGQASLSWKVGSTAKPGTFKVSVGVSAPGYKPKTMNTTFLVTK